MEFIKNIEESKAIELLKQGEKYTNDESAYITWIENKFAVLNQQKKSPKGKEPKVTKSGNIMQWESYYRYLSGKEYYFIDYKKSDHE